MPKIEVARIPHTTVPDHQPVASGEVVTWEIDTLNPGDALMITTPPDPYLVINATGAPDSKTLDVPVTYPTGPKTFTHPVPYTVYIKNRSQTEVGSGFLVIEPIGMGDPKQGHKQDHDRKR